MVLLLLYTIMLKVYIVPVIVIACHVTVVLCVKKVLMVLKTSKWLRTRINRPNQSLLTQTDKQIQSGVSVGLDAEAYPPSRSKALSELSAVELPPDHRHDPEFDRFWEIEQGSGQITDVQGRLKSSIGFWQEVLKAPQPVIEWVTEGYKLPFLSLPPPYFRKNQKSAHLNALFVSSAIGELLDNRCIQKVANKPHVCSPLSVVASSTGKLRLVLNLRYLNQFLLKDRFKYEDLRIAMQMFEPGDHMFTFDLKSGYHHLDIPATLELPGVLMGGRYLSTVLCILCASFWLSNSLFCIFQTSCKALERPRF